VIDGQTGRVLCVHETLGAVHDFELFKRSGVRLGKDILLVADKGYLGIHTLHAFSVMPLKKPRGGELTAQQKQFSRSVSGYRMRIEHVNRRIKCFKMFQYRYRNKQRKHLLRISLVCGLYNYERGF
jgi:hypothetical protein